MKTYKLTTSQYNGLYFDIQDIIKQQVNREAEKWSETIGSPIPQTDQIEYNTLIGRRFMDSKIQYPVLSWQGIIRLFNLTK